MIDASNWLESGALLYLGDNRYLLGYELINKLEKPSSGPSFYTPDFYLSTPDPWYIYNQYIEFSKLELLEFLEGIDGLKNFESVNNYNWQQPKQEKFNKYFDDIQKLIEKKELEKLVPIVFETTNVKMSQLGLAAKLIKLLKTVEGQSIYGHWHNELGVLGVTPELFFELANNKITTMALAGTGLATDTAGSLMNDLKEMHEHDLVVTNIKETLFSFGAMSTSETYEWSLNPLKHLRTDIEIEINENKFSNELIVQLIEKMHPTAALGVYPKSFNWRNIKNFEDMDRGQFGAPFGLNYQGKFRSVVSIRNIQWDNNGIRIGSGCGIVNDSNKEREWRELFNKRKSVKKYLGLEVNGK